MGWSLKNALTPPKWLRKATGLSSNQIRNVVTPSGYLNDVANAGADNAGALAEVAQAKQQQQLMLIGGIAVAYYLFK
jgi:hypothetical protein